MNAPNGLDAAQAARAAALQAATALVIARAGRINLPDVVRDAERLEEWIMSGTLPKPPAGTFDR